MFISFKNTAFREREGERGGKRDRGEMEREGGEKEEERQGGRERGEREGEGGGRERKGEREGEKERGAILFNRTFSSDPSAQY